MEKGETTAEHSKNQREEAEKLEADKANEDPKKGGLFQGFFKPKPQGPIFDAQDGVARCPNCHWELEEDACINCGYEIEDGTISSMSDFSDDFSDMTDDDDEEDMRDANPGYVDRDAAWVDEYPHPLPFGFQQLYHAAQNYAPNQYHEYPTQAYNQFLANPIFRRPPFAFANQASSSIAGTSENESEEDEDEEMDSFIDDDESGAEDSEDGSHTDHSTVVGDHDYMGYDGYDTGTDASVSQSGQSVEDEDDGGDDDSDEDEGGGPTLGIPERVRRRMLYQNNQPVGRDRNSPLFGLQNNGAGTSASNAINVDDDSEDEMPVSASRRARLNRR